MIQGNGRLITILTALIVVGMVVPGGALASHDGSSAPLSGSVDVFEVDDGTDGQIHAWERAAFPLRTDDTDAATQVPLPDDGIYGEEDTTLDGSDNGQNSQSLNPSVGGELVPPAGVHDSGDVTITFDSQRSSTALGNQDNVQLVAARLTPQDGKDLPSTTQDAIDLLSDVDDVNKNASFEMLNADRSLNSGEFEETHSFQQSGQYIIFAAVKEDGKNGFQVSGSDISVDGDVTIIGVDQLSIQDGTTTVTDEPENADPGDDLTFQIDSPDSYGNSVTHTVAVYRESTFKNSRFDFVVNPDALGTGFNASEDAQLEHTISEVNGVSDVEAGTTIFGNELSDRRVTTPTSLGAVADFFAEEAGANDPNTDPIGTTQIDASVTAVNGEPADTTVTVGTHGNFSSSAAYRYVVISSPDNNDTRMSTATGTLTLNGSPSSGGGGGSGDDGGDDGGVDTPPTDTPGPVQKTVTAENGSSTTMVSSVASGQTVSININQTGAVEDGSVSQLNITSTEDASDVRIRIRQVATPSDGTPENDRSPTNFRYIEVNLENLQNSDTTPGTFRFSVSEDRLESEDIDPENVQMYRFSNGSWNSIETTYLGNGQFSAKTGGFSWFAVGVEQPAQETVTDTEPTDEPVTDTEPVDETTDAEQQITTEGPDGDGDGLPLAIIGVIVAVVAIVAGVLYYRDN